MTDHLFQTWRTRYIIFLSILTYYVKYVQKEKEIKSTTYFCSFSSSWLQTCEFFICWKRNLWNRFKIKTVADSCVHSSDISGNLKWMKINLNFCYPVSTSSCVKGSFLPLKNFSINLYILLPQQCCFSDSPTALWEILLLHLPWNTDFPAKTQSCLLASGCSKQLLICYIDRIPFPNTLYLYW